MTGMANSSRQWTGETGRVNQEMLAKYIGDAKNPIYYITGPQGMVNGLQKTLIEAGIDSDDIRTEGFSGY